MRLISITPSHRKDKKMVAKFEDPKRTVHFGMKGSTTYIDDKDPARQKAYLDRHRENETWNNPTSPGSLARYILWGDSTSLKKNISAFKKRFNL
jgi:hypothetical protein